MPDFLKLIIAMSFLLVTACSTDAVKRATYGSLEQIQRQQCYKEMGSNCEKSENYDVYQDRRKELEKTK